MKKCLYTINVVVIQKTEQNVCARVVCGMQTLRGLQNHSQMFCVSPCWAVYS